MRNRSFVTFVLVTLLFTTAAAAQNCPDPAPVVINDSRPPADVCIPKGSNAPIEFFDDYSWRAFIAMVWPAKNGQRGVPDTSKTVGGSGPRVFETYKMLHEVFHNDGSSPSAWNSYDLPQYNACNVQMQFGDLVLASFSKYSNLGQAGFGTLVGPLVAQNRTYVRFETAFNAAEFGQIMGGKWYLRANIPVAGVTFNDGAIDIKSSWIEMTDIPNPSRYYTRTAWVLNPLSGSCSQKTVGLVGLHIVQKTPTRPQWLWTSFEQVDNVPGRGAKLPYGFNEANGTPMPSKNPYKIDPLPLPTPPPFNVSRVKKIHVSTEVTNVKYKTALAGTPWQFYQLVVTQWPLCNPTCKPEQRGNPAFTFPGSAPGTDETSFANTTLETFDQASVFTSCMACHNSAQTVAAVKNGTDFLWSLKDHAFPANVPGLLFGDPQFKELQSLLLKSVIPAAQAKAAAQRDKAFTQKKNQ
jgi:hypothetical protein